MSGKIDDLPKRLALDARATQDLRNKFAQDPEGGLKAAAQQFEGMFLQMVLKSMRDTVPQDGMLSSDSTRFYTSMLDQQLAQELANRPGLGFAKLIEQQLGRTMNTAATSGSTASTAAPAGNSLPLTVNDTRHLSVQATDALNRLTAALRGADGSVVAAGSDALASGGDGVPVSTREFANRVWPSAVEASRATGIPPQFLVAHAALESGWGKGEIRRADGSGSYNLFGIKAGKSWTGPVVEASTTEYVDGVAQKVNEKFRAYSSYAEAFRDYASLLRDNPRYGVVIGSQDGTEFAKRLQQAGYATDPAYAEKLARIINGPTLRQALIG